MLVKSFFMFKFRTLDCELCTFPCFSTLVDLCKLNGVVISTLKNNKRIFFFFITWSDLDFEVDGTPTLQEKKFFIQGVIFLFLDPIFILFRF
jgi:hypothetical protein